MQDKETRTNTLKETLQWLKAILLAVVIALLIRGFIFEPVIVQGESMENTLHTGQRLIVYKLGYYLFHPERGDIIVLQYQEGIINRIPLLKDLPFVRQAFPAIQEVDYIKRVIGIPGDKIDLKDGHVYRNGKMLDEAFIKGETYGEGMEMPVIVPPDSVFVMGDNRENSRDSRSTDVGFVEFKKIKGKAVFRIWPLAEAGKVE